MFNPEFMLPGNSGNLVSRKGSVVNREEFDEMMTDYYNLRGWDSVSGLQKEDNLETLGLAEIIPEMKKLKAVIN